MTAVEVNPVAAALAAVNVALNRMTGVVSVRCGDLYDAVGSQRFDTIVANPPLVAIPADLPYPFVGHGGADGMRVIWSILRGLDEHLSESGVAQLIGTTLSDGLLPLPLPALERWASRHGFDATMTITSHTPAGPGSSWSAGVTATIVEHARGHVQLTEDELAERYLGAAASHVCAYFLRLRRGRGSLMLLDLSETNDEFWFA